MELEVKNIIFGTVRDLILEQQPEKWIAISTEIYEKLDQLNPTICEGGDIGKIAFGSSERRMKIKTARFLTRKLRLNSGFLNDVEIRTIQTSIDEILFGEMVQTYISTGSDIEKNYYNEIGGPSCMSGFSSGCVGLYVDNPDTYSQLIMKRGNDSARAMIVKLDNGKYMLDRIYTDAEDLTEKMKNYADDQGWIVGYDRDISESGLSTLDFIVTGLTYTDGEVPYQDTLGFGRIRNGLLDLLADRRHGHDFTMDDTGGNIDGGGYECCDCGDRVSEEDYWSTDNGIYCPSCSERFYFICNYCNDTTSDDDRRHINNEGIEVCPHCADTQYAFCDECDEYFSTEFVAYIESAEKSVCDDCVDRDYRQCTDCNELFDKNDMVELENNESICEDCREIELQKDIGDCLGQLLLPFKDQKCLPLELSLSA
jgi:hypothetical protein